MGKRRSVPSTTREQVLKEFNHRCAICGGDHPHLHHIDKDPSNNDVGNLIPLCPNCHLTDQHAPTRAVEPGILKLLRKHKNPTLLKPQFYPLFIRFQFLENISDDVDARRLEYHASELVEFVSELEMGSFYAKRLTDLVEKPKYVRILVIGDPYSEHRYHQETLKYDQEYRKQLLDNREKVLDLVVELLRFQNW